MHPLVWTRTQVMGRAAAVAQQMVISFDFGHVLFAQRRMCTDDCSTEQHPSSHELLARTHVQFHSSCHTWSSRY